MKQANRIKDLRIKKGISLRELSELTKVSKTMLSNLENGNRTGTIEVLTTLANFYNVSLDYLTCNPKRAMLIDLLVENLIQEGIINEDEPLTPEVKKMIEDAVNIKIKSVKKDNEN